MEQEDSRNSCACKCLRIPGFRFTPSDEILVGYYLRRKVEDRPLRCNHYVTEFKIYDECLMPWDILKDDDHHWITTSSSNDSCTKISKTMYVFTRLCRNKTRVTRRSGAGSWTAQNTRVVNNVAGDKIGYKKLFTFYRDNDDKLKKKKKIIDGDHGHWIMHEYSLLGIEDYVLCEIIKEVEMSDEAATTKQDFHTHGQNLVSQKEVVLPVADVIVAADTYPPHEVGNLNVVLGQLGGGDHDDQPVDESGADWDQNGWSAELDKELGLDILDDTVAADVVEDLPILAVAGMNEPLQVQVQSVPNFFVEEKDVTVLQEQPRKRMRTDVDGYQKFPSCRKKQRLGGLYSCKSHVQHDHFGI